MSVSGGPRDLGGRAGWGALAAALLLLPLACGPFSYDAVAGISERLAAQGEGLDPPGGLEWFGAVDPNWQGVAGFLVAAALVLGLAWARLRVPGWPLHPVALIVLGTWASRKLAVSFLIGCLVKFFVTRYGGTAAYNRLRPVMIGLIAGELVAGLLPMLIGAVYYFVTGEVPKAFTVLPL